MNSTHREYAKTKIIQVSLTESLKHGILVSNLAGRLARQLGLAESFCRDMAVAGMLHDIGKLGLIRDIYGEEKEILTVEEMRYIRRHAGLGCEILKGQGYSDHICESVGCHHENFDGSGYPNNLEGTEIPLGGRILRVCDVFAALISDRPYRKAFKPETALELMIEEVKNFDMKIFLAFQQVVHEAEVRQIWQDIIRNKEEEISWQ